MRRCPAGRTYPAVTLRPSGPRPGIRISGRGAVKSGEARQRGSGSASAAHTADLNTFDGGTGQCLNEGFAQRSRVGGEPEIRPVNPPVLPGHPVQVAADQIYGELGVGLIGVVDPQTAPTDQPPRGQRHDSECFGFPSLAHPVSVIHTTAGAMKIAARRKRLLDAAARNSAHQLNLRLHTWHMPKMTS